MMKWMFILMLIPLIGFTQEVEKDTLAAEIGQPVVVQDEVILLADTVKPNFSPQLTDLEYIPADDSPELIADRLSCLQQTVPLTYNDKVHAFINYFLIRDRDHTRMVMRKKELFFPLFEEQLKAHHLPDELKYLAIIESGLYPRAISRAHAVGLWQFMSGTGRYFGLKIDWYVDERMDPEKSTVAACKYLIQLHKIFKDWELALAAYNSGPGTVRRAIRRSGHKKSFWEIYQYLPRETRAYVPQYVAMIYALNHSADHNLFIDGPEEPLRQDTLHVRTFLQLNTLANLTGTCLEDLQRLNPAVQHYVIPGDGKLHIVKMPVQAKIELNKNRKAILDSASRTNKSGVEAVAKSASGNTAGREKVVYYVKSGDALSVIAERFRVRTSDIKNWNNLSSNIIRTGQRLNLWVLPSGQLVQTPLPSPSPPVALSPDSKTYIVQPGDTLWDISRKFQGLTIERIKSLNNLKTNKLQPGQKLIIG